MLALSHNDAAKIHKAAGQARLWGVMWCVGILLLTQAACQKQGIKVNGHELGRILAADRTHATGVPVDLPGALEAPRSYFQTRGMITLTITSDQISTSSPLELVNATTGLSPGVATIFSCESIHLIQILPASLATAPTTLCSTSISRPLPSMQSKTSRFKTFPTTRRRRRRLPATTSS